MDTEEYKFDEKEEQLLELLKNKNKEKPKNLLKLNKTERSDFHSYLINELVRNKNYELKGESKDVGKKAEKILKELTKQFVKDNIDENAKNKDFEPRPKQIGDKGLEDFRYKNIFFDSKVKKVENFDFTKMYQEDDTNILSILTIEELKNIINNKKYEIKKNYGNITHTKFTFTRKSKSELILIIENYIKQDYYEEIQELATNKLQNKTTGDAQLISYVKLKKELEKNFKMFYIILLYEQKEQQIKDEKTNKIKKTKINKIKFVYVVDIYKIDFSKLSIYLSNQFYFSNKEFYDKSLEPEGKQYKLNKMIEHIDESIIRERKKQIKKYIVELNSIQKKYLYSLNETKRQPVIDLFDKYYPIDDNWPRQ